MYVAVDSLFCRLICMTGAASEIFDNFVVGKQAVFSRFMQLGLKQFLPGSFSSSVMD